MAVLNNSAKNPLFTVEERVELLKECCKKASVNVSVESFDGLTVEFAKKTARFGDGAGPAGGDGF